MRQIKCFHPFFYSFFQYFTVFYILIQTVMFSFIYPHCIRYSGISTPESITTTCNTKYRLKILMRCYQIHSKLRKQCLETAYIEIVDMLGTKFLIEIIMLMKLLHIRNNNINHPILTKEITAFLYYLLYWKYMFKNNAQNDQIKLLFLYFNRDISYASIMSCDTKRRLRILAIFF